MADHNEFHRLFRVAAYPIMICFVIVLLGCGGSNKTGTVSGIITYKGKPLNSGTITFFGKDDKPASGTIDAEGKYTVTNVPAGDAKIAIRVPPPIPEKKADKVPHREGEKQVDPIQIPATYAEKSTTELTYTVTTGNQDHPIELK